MLIPLSDDNDDYDVPIVNRAIILICFAVFFYELYLTEHALRDFVRAFGFNAHEYINGATGWAKLKGALQATFDVRRTGWITAVTSQFIHADAGHIAGNMFFLWIFGDNVEHVMGRVRYVAFFLLTGMLAAFSQAFIGMDIDVPCIGASGAISGVMGAYLVFYPRAMINMCFFWSWMFEPKYFRMKAWMYLGFFVATQLCTGLLTWGIKYFMVAVWAHIGGFLFGALLARLFKDPSMLFKEEGEKMLGLDGKEGDLRGVEEYHEYVMAIGRRAGFDGGTSFGPAAHKIHRRPSLKEMRKKGAAERAETKKKRGW
jgi:membrane associated rhomboid family serine protease